MESYLVDSCGVDNVGICTIWYWGMYQFQEPVFYYVVGPLSALFFFIGLCFIYGYKKHGSGKDLIAAVGCFLFSGLIWLVVIIIAIVGILIIIAACFCFCICMKGHNKTFAD